MTTNINNVQNIEELADDVENISAMLQEINDVVKESILKPKINSAKTDDNKEEEEKAEASDAPDNSDAENETNNNVIHVDFKTRVGFDQIQHKRMQLTNIIALYRQWTEETYRMTMNNKYRLKRNKKLQDLLYENYAIIATIAAFVPSINIPDITGGL